MTELYIVNAITYGTTRYYLPPWCKISVQMGQTIDAFPTPQTNQLKITSVRPNQGSKLSLVASGFKSTRDHATTLAWLQELCSQLAGRKFNLFEWSDRAWTGCAMQTFAYESGSMYQTGLKDIKIDLLSESFMPNTDIQLSFSNYASEYPYAAVVGRPVGGAVIPGTLIAATEPIMQSYSGIFQGLIEDITPNGYEFAYTVGGETTSRWTATLQVTGCDKETSLVDDGGATKIRLQTVPFGILGGSALTAQVAKGAIFGEASSGSFEVSGGDKVYVGISEAGKHSNLQFTVRLNAK